MLLTDAVPSEVFNVLLAVRKRMSSFNYFCGWPVQEFSTIDQFLTTLNYEVESSSKGSRFSRKIQQCPTSSIPEFQHFMKYYSKE